ncbi:MAG: hypothetical protein QOD06_47 [Candidatus Binatota bacterium]|jgi:hypothetical protein|nr:hypothetical protein [Candidatus Binatota bacterium]
MLSRHGVVAGRPASELGMQVLQSASMAFFLLWLFGAFGAVPPPNLP